MRILVVLLALVFLGTQYLLWFGQSGHFTQARLQQQLERQERQVEVIRERNQILAAEVIALKNDESTLEARAREDLGMVKKGEVFYLVPNVE
ncbi:MAG: cell division protein FtsB [Pseudomonadales bacterium]|nr:cell division protein FtsB [Pseudomonadales bacterium]